MYPTTPAAPMQMNAAQAPQQQQQTMQPLGAPGTPASPQALPYNYFPAPRIGPASATQPATPIAPMIQNTQAQIGDALAAARGPQPPPQLAVQPPGGYAPGGSRDPAPGALGMAAGMPQHQQQPSPWAGMFPPGQGPQMQGQNPQMQPLPLLDNASTQGRDWRNAFPPEMREMMSGLGGHGRRWGGFNWNAQQGDPGRTPYAHSVPQNFPQYPAGGGRPMIRGYDDPQGGGM